MVNQKNLDLLIYDRLHLKSAAAIAKDITTDPTIGRTITRQGVHARLSKNGWQVTDSDRVEKIRSLLHLGTVDAIVKASGLTKDVVDRILKNISLP